MTLSRDDLRRLRRIEHGTWLSDPGWARSMTDTTELCRQRQRRRRWVVVLVVDAVAAVTILVGALAAAFPVIFLGLLVGATGMSLHVRRI